MRTVDLCYICDMKKLFVQIIVVAAVMTAVCGKATATEIKSVPTGNLPVEAMVTVAVPEYYDTDTSVRFPVVYLLNGHGGDHRSWSGIVDLDSLATAHGIVIVCPAGLNSWYWDSPADIWLKMESYITQDLVPWVDRNYRTKACAGQRAVTGLSMGGHGGLWLALRHPDIFGNAGSTSGGVDFRPWPGSWNIAERLGKYEDNKDVWDSHTVMSLIDLPSVRQVNIIFDCGEQDFFFEVNNRLHEALTERGIAHVYLTSPGVHNGEYWRRSILPQLVFFSTIFNHRRSGCCKSDR